MWGRGLLSGLSLTFRTMFKKSVTVQYPHEREEHAPRARGVIALKEENCTVCMLCARECPVWCIFIEGYKDQGPPRKPGGKPRLAQKLDRFDIDYSLCMYCGICVDVCPFDALFWSTDAEYSEPRIADLLHDKSKLGAWMATVKEKPALEEGAEVKEKRARVGAVATKAESSPTAEAKLEETPKTDTNETQTPPPESFT
jgi:NADH-quinone oxidoreductase subunit I